MPVRSCQRPCCTRSQRDACSSTHEQSGLVRGRVVRAVKWVPAAARTNSQVLSEAVLYAQSEGCLQQHARTVSLVRGRVVRAVKGVPAAARTNSQVLSEAVLYAQSEGCLQQHARTVSLVRGRVVRAVKGVPAAARTNSESCQRPCYTRSQRGACSSTHEQ